MDSWRSVTVPCNTASFCAHVVAVAISLSTSLWTASRTFWAAASLAVASFSANEASSVMATCRLCHWANFSGEMPPSMALTKSVLNDSEVVASVLKAWSTLACKMAMGSRVSSKASRTCLMDPA